MRKILLINLPALLLTACDPAPAYSPDYTPIEDGMRFLGVAFVVAALVGVIGASRKGGGQ